MPGQSTLFGTIYTKNLLNISYFISTVGTVHNITKSTLTTPDSLLWHYGIITVEVTTGGHISP